MKFGQMYIHDALNLERFIKRAETDESLAALGYDTMVGTGLSGALVIPALALALKKKWAIVRREDDQSHHHREDGVRIEGEIGDSWLFVDDFICSGRTFRYVEATVREAFRNASQEVPPLAGGYLYYGNERRTALEMARTVPGFTSEGVRV